MPYTDTDVAFFRSHLKTSGGVEIFIKHLMQVGQQNVHTPFSLCREMIGELSSYTSLSDKQIAVLFNIEFLHVLVREFEVPVGNLTIYVDDEREFDFCKYQYGMKAGSNLFLLDMERTIEEKGLYTTKGKVMKKFSVICGNPPYQAPREQAKDTNKGTRGSVLWDKFVSISIDQLCEENGHVCLVHPAGWRRPNKRSCDLSKKMTDKKILYLELHSVADGVQTFGATTNYDWYVLQNSKNQGEKTRVKDYTGVIRDIDVRDWTIIPNEQFELVSKILAKDGDEKIQIIIDRSNYGHDKKHMSSKKTSSFKYPCVYSLPMKGMQLWYSNTKDNGHFGIPKVISSNGAAAQVIVDESGQYGLTEWAFGIVDEVKNLPKIKQAMESEKFINLCKSFRFTLDRYDDDCFRLFKKDFWKEFV